MTRDVWLILAMTGASALVVGLVGVLVVARVRRASLVAALVVGSLVPFVAVVLAVAVSVGAMFLSDHDAFVARLVLGISAVPAAVLAAVLGRLLVADLRLAAESVRGLDGTSETSSSPVTAEVAALVDELDVTRERLRAAREREKALESARRQMVAFVSHDLRSPLAGVRATVEGLRDGVLPDVGAAYEGIDAAVLRMDRMIEDLAEMSRPDAERPPVRPAVDLDLAEVLEQVLAHAAAAASSHGVTLETAVQPGLQVRGVGDDLGRVLDNLVANAVRSSGRGGRVRVAGRRRDGEVLVTVEDTCGGLDEDERSRVFEEGWQGSRHAVQGTAGAEGLGLAIVGTVVSAHGGEVRVEPTGAGCTFEVRLPTGAAN